MAPVPGTSSDPVARRFADPLPTATEEHLAAVEVGDSESVAQWFNVDRALVDQHPIAGHVVLLIRILDWLGVNENLLGAEKAAARLSSGVGDAQVELGTPQRPGGREVIRHTEPGSGRPRN